MCIDMARMSQDTISRLCMLSCENVAERLGIEVRRHKAICFMHEDHHFSARIGRDGIALFVTKEVVP